MADSSSSKRTCLIILGIVVGFTIIILIVISFGYVDFYQLALKRQKSTGRVFTDKTYTGGRHFIGPDFTFKTYPATGQLVNLRDVGVFTSDELIVQIDVAFVYFIRPSQLKQLHEEYQLNYHSVIVNKAIDAIKNAAIEFSTVEFIMNRTLVENAMASATRRRIGGRCCEDEGEFNFPDCIPLRSCRKYKDIGLMSNVKYFYATKFTMPNKVERRYLQEMILVQQSEEEQLKLKEAVENKLTDEQVKSIENDADVTINEATANAAFIMTNATAQAEKLIGEFRKEGLKEIKKLLRFSTSDHLISFHYLKSLHESQKVNMAVDFQSYGMWRN